MKEINTRRLFGFGITLAIGMGILLWLLLLISASANTQVVVRYYPHLVALNILVVLTLLGLVGWQLRKLWQDSRARIFGAQLKLRLMVMFGLVSVIPGVLVYAVSVQFITRSIDSWFNVRVETALESGLNLGRAALDFLQDDITRKTHALAVEMGDKTVEERRTLMVRYRDQLGAQSAALVTLTGRLIMSDQMGVEKAGRMLPTPSQLKQVRLSRVLSQVEGEGADQLTLRVLVLVNPMHLGGEVLVLQIIKGVPESLARNAEEVQTGFRDYQELHLAHSGLTQIYALTLTLTVLVALFGAFAVAFYLAKRLAAPLYLLTQGTQAVAQGDFSPRLVFNSQDELGGLTESFNQMTRQLEEARRETDRHRQELEAARAYLESILANLSAGVLVFDKRFVLRTMNEGAITILGAEFEHAVGKLVDEWPLLQSLGRFVRDGFARMEDEIWENQFELASIDAPKRTLLLRGSRLSQASGGYVLVFDDVSELIAAQRSVAWGEVARRLAHEIKNPLTPIQLSAERLQMRLSERLSETDADMLARGTQTIINQVQAMKNMVDDFRDYARMPLPQLAPLDLNGLIMELLGLYESSAARFEPALAPDLPWVIGDQTQLRQIIHNLLRNAEDALEGRPEGLIEIRTEPAGRLVKLVLRDNGPGFPAEILPRVFEPYVTTKPKGTGLGLPIVKKIVDEHQGRIEITNRPEGGAQIVLRLPAVAEVEPTE